MPLRVGTPVIRFHVGWGFETLWWLGREAFGQLLKTGGSTIVGDNPTSVSLGLTDGSEFIGSTQGKYVPCNQGTILINLGLIPSSGLGPRWASDSD